MGTKLIPEAWLPKCSMTRVHSHWTGGTHKASDLERAHYHILVQGDGSLVRGFPSIKDNAAPLTDKYAAHTLHANTGAIGVSICAMLDAASATAPGPCPLNELQWDTAAKVVAELCAFYNVPVGPTTVLQHSEVQKNLGITQRGKWDVSVLPFAPHLTAAEVYADFRARVAKHLGAPPEEPSVPVTVNVKGRDYKGFLVDGAALAPARAIEKAGVVRLLQIDNHEGRVQIECEGRKEWLPLYTVDGTGYVPSRGLAALLNVGISYDPKNKTVTLG